MSEHHSSSKETANLVPDLLSLDLQAVLAQVIFTRHGKTQHNELRVLQGSSDDEMALVTEAGLLEMNKQSESLVLAGIVLAYILTSPLRRALQTAQVFSRNVSATDGTEDSVESSIIPVAQLHEYSYGDWELQPISTILANPNNEKWTRYRFTMEEESGPSGSEDFVGFLSRITRALHIIKEALVDRPPGVNEYVMVICHAEVLRAVRFLYLLAELHLPITATVLADMETQFSFTADGQFMPVPHGILKLVDGEWQPFLD